MKNSQMQTIVIKVDQEIISRLDAVVLSPEISANEKISTIRGVKLSKIFQSLERGSSSDEVDRLHGVIDKMRERLESAQVKAEAYDKASASLKDVSEQVAKLNQQAQSRNSIIRSLISVLSEVGF